MFNKIGGATKKMKKELERVELGRLKNQLNVITVIGCLLFIMVVIIAGIQDHNLQKQIDKIPKKVCHTELTSEVWIIDFRREFSYDTEILCEEGVTINEFKILRIKSINALSDGDVRGKTCIIKTPRELCEIK